MELNLAGVLGCIDSTILAILPVALLSLSLPMPKTLAFRQSRSEWQQVTEMSDSATFMTELVTSE